MKLEHKVTEDENGSRADRVVRNIYADVGYVFLQKLFRTGKIKSNGVRIDASTRLQTGNIISIFCDLEKIEQKPILHDEELLEKLQGMIIFEHMDFFAINKPVNLSVQPGTKVKICVENYIKAYPSSSCHLVHRLDKNTSGVLLIAKNLQAARKLTEMFRENRIKKTYLAFVDGIIQKSGVIDNYMIESSDGKRMAIATSGLKAITNYNPIKVVNNYTLMELLPNTGRKHQLRLHCADSLNTPILGDAKYNKNCVHKTMFLHAHKIFIEDLKIEIVADIPEYFKEICDVI